MAHEKYICLLVLYLSTVSAFSIDYKNERQGKKLFGGYRISAKTCQSTNPGKIKSSSLPRCMFNDECSHRNGEVVGTCLDGFLFGACCQLPSDDLFDKFEGIDHSPDIPILLKPDGTPIGSKIEDYNTKSTPSDAFLQSQVTELQNKFPVFLEHQTVMSDLSLPNLLSYTGNNDIQDHQLPESISPVTTLHSPNQVLQIADTVDQLPELFSQAISQRNHTPADTILLNKNGSVLTDNENDNIEQLFVPIINHSSQSSSHYLSTEGIQQPSESTTKSAGTTKYYNSYTTGSDMITKPGLVRVSTITTDNNKKHDDTMEREEIAIHHIISILNNNSNPIGGSNYDNNRIPPHRDSVQQINSNSNNAGSLVHTWVTVEDTSLPSTSSETFPYTYIRPTTKPTNFYYYDTAPSSTTIRPPSTGSTRPASFNNGNSGTSYGSSSSIYSYTTRPTTNPPAPTVIVLGPLSNDYTTVTTSKPYTKRPNHPTSYTRPSVINIKNKPNITTTITHNISTFISTANLPGTSSSGSVMSTSFINVSMKDKPASTSSELPEIITKKPSNVWTTISTVSTKPAFFLKPTKNDFEWPNDELTPVQTIVLQTTKKPLSSSTTTMAAMTTKHPTITLPSLSSSSFFSSIPTTTKTTTSKDDDETAPPDDISAFPPDRNPNLTITSSSHKDKLPVIKLNNTGYPDIEIITENDITTPSFIEDDVLGNKVGDFVFKIVDSLQGDFENLQDVVYSRKNVTDTTETITTTTTTTTTLPPPTKKPTTITKKPTSKPTVTRKPTVRKPTISSTSKPTINKPTKVKPNSQTSSSTTKKPSTKRPKPSKKPTTLSSTIITTTETVSTSEMNNLITQSSSANDYLDEPLTTPDYRRECGVRPLVKKGRIVGGKSSTFGEWPWQVLVRESTWLGLFTKNKCGGVLITDKYVITAAHCQPGFLASLITEFGEYDVSGNLEPRRSVTRNVKRVYTNRGYNPSTFENDLALLELESPIQFDAHIVPICMPPDDADYTGQMATVTGWGRLKYNGGIPSVLQEVQVPIMENSVCQEMFNKADHKKTIVESFLCAGYASGLKDSCEGDSGGPLMIEGSDGRWMLVGTVSHGIKCAAPYLPGVYMRTTFFKPWLHAVTGV
ncbi:serine protease filzig isoform X2 [Aphidius gifuensis]|nr:serine protease filzig isoform X2 [Aphidius gifuensis]